MMNLLKSSFLLSVWEIIKRGKLIDYTRDLWFVIELTVFVFVELTLFVFSLCSGGGSLFTNSNWFAFEDEKADDENEASSSPNNGDDDNEKDLADAVAIDDGGSDKNTEWVEWRECSDSIELSPTSSDAADANQFPNGEMSESEAKPDNEIGDPPAQSAEVEEKWREEASDGSHRWIFRISQITRSFPPTKQPLNLYISYYFLGKEEHILQRILLFILFSWIHSDWNVHFCLKYNASISVNFVKE